MWASCVGPASGHAKSSLRSSRSRFGIAPEGCQHLYSCREDHRGRCRRSRMRMTSTRRTLKRPDGSRCHGVEVPRVGNALELADAGILESDARARDKVLYGLRDENLGGSRMGRHA